MVSMFWGAAAGVVTAFEVRRKVWVAPLGLRALFALVLASETSNVHSCAESRWKWHGA